MVWAWISCSGRRTAGGGNGAEGADHTRCPTPTLAQPWAIKVRETRLCLCLSACAESTSQVCNAEINAGLNH